MFDDFDCFSFSVTHPLFDSAVVLPKFLRSLVPGTASIYSGYFGSGATALYGTASLAAGPCLDKPLTTNFLGLGLFTGSHVTVGSNITIGNHTVLGAADTSLSAIMQGLNAFRGKVVPEENVCTPAFNINAASIDMNGGLIEIGGGASGITITTASGALTGTWTYNGAPICAPCPSSDIRLKKDIEPLTNSLEKILQLQGVSFNWKEDLWPEKAEENPNGEIGVIAQEVENIVPEVVREFEIIPNSPAFDDPNRDAKTQKMSIKGVKYENLVALLIEGMKEQQQQIEELKERIAVLEANK
jgi:hypothetical protein